MFLPKSVNVPIQSRHNNDKGEGGNVREKAHWSPHRSLKFHPTKLVRLVEVGEVVSEEKKHSFQEFQKLCLNKKFPRGFSRLQIRAPPPESLLSAEAAKKCEVVMGGGHEDAGGKREQDQATLDTCPHLGGER